MVLIVRSKLRKKESDLYVIDEDDDDETDYDKTPLSSGVRSGGFKRRHGADNSPRIITADSENEEEDDDEDDDEDEPADSRIRKSVAAGLVVGGASTVAVPVVGENGTEEADSEDEEELPDW